MNPLGPTLIASYTSSSRSNVVRMSTWHDVGLTFVRGRAGRGEGQEVFGAEAPPSQLDMTTRVEPRANQEGTKCWR